MRKAEYNAYMRTYMKRRYHERRAVAIEKLGGKCVRCGATAGLQFDHIDRGKKNVGLGKILASGSEEAVARELALCQLLCGPCHVKKGRAGGEFREKGMAVRRCACGREFSTGRALGGHRGGRGACKTKGP